MITIGRSKIEQKREVRVEIEDEIEGGVEQERHDSSERVASESRPSEWLRVKQESDWEASN